MRFRSHEDTAAESVRGERYPVAILYALAGSPPQDGCAGLDDAGCRVCGAQGIARGIAFARWLGQSFTDQNKLRDWGALHVCEPCVWAHAWNVPPGFPPPEDGKKGVNLRLYSHFWCAGDYHAWNKASKPQIREWLRTPKTGPWFAAIADSGQKHVLPWTPLNHSPRGMRVRFEEQNITLGDFALVDAMTAALTAGITKEEIERGEYGVRAWTIARRHVESFESDHGKALRGSGWFALALWMSQRNEEAVAERLAAEKETKEARGGSRAKRQGAGRDERLPDGDPIGVPTPVPEAIAESLEPAGERRTVGGDARPADSEPVGAEGGRQAARPLFKQISLFGD